MSGQFSLEEAVKKINAHADCRHGCAYAVLQVMQEELGMESDLIPGIALGFGGGLGRRGLVCGALNGGVLAIGLRHGQMRETEDKETTYALVLELCRSFEGQHGSALCRDLTGCDFTTP